MTLNLKTCIDNMKKGKSRIVCVDDFLEMGQIKHRMSMLYVASVGGSRQGLGASRLTTQFDAFRSGSAQLPP